MQRKVESFFEDVSSDVAGKAAEQITKVEDQLIIKEINDKLGAGQNRMTTTAKPSRFRKRYRQLSDAELALCDTIKDYAAKLEFIINCIGPTRETALALTHLEEAVQWAIKEVNGDSHGDDEKLKAIIRKATRAKAD